MPPNATPEDVLTQGEIDVPSLEEALAEALAEAVQHSSVPSPVSSDSEPEPQSSEDDTPTRTRRNTIMTSKQKEGETSKREEGTGLSIGTRKPKIREPSIFLRRQRQPEKMVSTTISIFRNIGIGRRQR